MPRPPERRAATAGRPGIGDRLEGALEQHADVEGEIARGQARSPPRRRIVRTAVMLAVTGVSLYLVAPTLLNTLSSWRNLEKLSPGWAAAMIALQAVSVLCLWILQHVAMAGSERR